MKINDQSERKSERVKSQWLKISKLSTTAMRQRSRKKEMSTLSNIVLSMANMRMNDQRCSLYRKDKKRKKQTNVELAELVDTVQVMKVNVRSY